MKREVIQQRCIISLILAVFCVVPSQSAFAQVANDFPPIRITEIMPGSKESASQEFIELYNQSSKPIDLEEKKWELQIATSKATSWDNVKSIPLTGVVNPGAYILLSSDYAVGEEEKTYLQEYAWEQFSPGLTSTSGHVRIVTYSDENESPIPIDVVEWASKNAAGDISAGGISSQPILLQKPLRAGASLKRLTTKTHTFTNEMQVSLCPSPTASNEKPTGTLVAPVATTIDIVNPLCAEPEAPRGVNEDDPEILLPSEEPPATFLPAAPTQSDKSRAQPSIPSSNKGLRGPRITELLPNPKASGTDAQSEFIELYNENNTPFELSGYVLRIGSAGAKKYTFPKGTIIKPKAFTAFFARTTRISLSNSAGQVVLVDPLGNMLSSSDVYETAKDDTSWAFASGRWQWTSKPTPNASNVIQPPTSRIAGTSVQKSSSASAAPAGKITSDDAPAPNATNSKQDAKESVIHPMILVAVGVFALLYGVYEYRHDLANKLFQFRSYRAARRKARQGTKGS